MGKDTRKWTEKRIREKIREIENSINYQKRLIKRAEGEIADLEILLKYFKDKLGKKFDNPSSKKFGGEP